MPRLFKLLAPHLLVFAVFFVIAYLFVKPSFEGKNVQAVDAVQYEAMVHGMTQERKETGISPKWNRNMFSGMPFYFAYLEDNPLATYIFGLLYHVFNLQFASFFTYTFFSYFFISCVSFYFLSMIMGLRPLFGLIGALGFAYSTHNPILVIAGHHTKLMSIAFMPYVLATVVLVLKKRYWLGVTLGMLAAGRLFSYAHYQIVFYTILSAGFVFAGYMLAAYLQVRRQKMVEKLLTYRDYWRHLIFSTLSLLLILGIGVFRNVNSFMATKDYSTVSTRNGSSIVNLSAQKNPENKVNVKQDKGVGKSYAFNWSVMPSELFTFIAPDIYGAATGGVLNENSNTFQKLKAMGASDEQSLSFVRNLPTYWGEQPFTVGPIYYGIIVCILVIFALYYYRSIHMWWILPLTVFAILISMGKYLPWINYPLYDYLPYYNKFRSPSMVLCIPQITFPLLAMLGLQKLLYSTLPWPRLAFKRSIITLLVILGMICMFYLTASYSDVAKDNELTDILMRSTQENKNVANMLLAEIRADRKDMLWGDIVRIVSFSLSFVVLLYSFYKNYINRLVTILMCGSLLFADLMYVSKQYLNYDSFLINEQLDEEGNPDQSRNFPLRQVDIEILKDKDPNYRVLDLTRGSPFNTATPSYYHRHIGGYYAAKLSIYQDLIDSCLNIQRGPNPAVLSMLNTRYVIVPGNPQERLIQLIGLGPVWWIEKLSFVPDSYHELQALKKFNPMEQAFIETKFRSQIPSSDTLFKNEGKIWSTLSRGDKMTYQSERPSPGLAIFSEIYCDKGWKAYIDDKEVPILKANFVLRALYVPAGNHKIEFIFHPNIFNTTKKIQLVVALIAVVIVSITLWFERWNILKLFKLERT